MTVLAGGKPEFFERLGEASAAKNLATLHSGYLTKGNPQAFLAKAPAIYGMYYETGRREYQQTGDRSAVITTHDAETFSGPDCLTVIGWYRKGLEMCGAAGVKIVEEECRARGGQVCRYAITWNDAARPVLAPSGRGRIARSILGGTPCADSGCGHADGSPPCQSSMVSGFTR